MMFLGRNSNRSMFYSFFQEKIHLLLKKIECKIIYLTIKFILAKDDSHNLQLIVKSSSSLDGDTETEIQHVQITFSRYLYIHAPLCLVLTYVFRITYCYRVSRKITKKNPLRSIQARYESGTRNLRFSKQMRRLASSAVCIIVSLTTTPGDNVIVANVKLGRSSKHRGYDEHVREGPSTSNVISVTVTRTESSSQTSCFYKT